MRALLEGFGLGASLIIAIGAQNAFVLRQGLAHEHVLTVVSVSAACDSALIALGVAGLGTIIASSDTLTAVATWGGAVFLFVYGLRSFWSAFRAGTLEPNAADSGVVTLRTTVLVTLGMSLLNPHVYLDTVVLIGSLGARHPLPDRLAFAGGAMASSIIWFFSLGYGARRLRPFFSRPSAWRVLDVLVGAVMWSIAGSLLLAA